MLSHKLCWQGPHGLSSTGGFLRQIAALSELFTATELAVPVRSGIAPGTVLLADPSLVVRPLKPLPVDGWHRRLALPGWTLYHAPALVRAIRAADVVHIPLPSDVGSLGVFLTLLCQQRLFIRHCGTWGEARSWADRFWNWLLPHLAGRRAVVLATGAGSAPPSRQNPAISWIFSTSLRAAELPSLSPSRGWTPGEPLRLISVARLDHAKNVQAAIAALPAIRKVYPETTLTILGDGPLRAELTRLAEQQGQAAAVVFTGQVTHEEVLVQLQRSHLLIFPTRVAEGFPKAVLEAMACGVLVVAPAVSVIPQLIAGCGQVLPSTTPADVAAVVLGLLAEPEQLAEMSRRARVRAQDYTLERWRATIAAHLQQAWGLPLSCTE